MDSQAIIELQYLPPIPYMACWAHFDEIIIILAVYLTVLERLEHGTAFLDRVRAVREPAAVRIFIDPDECLVKAQVRVHGPDHPHAGRINDKSP